MARATAQKDNATYGIQRLILRQTQMPRDVFIIYQSVKTSMLAGQSAKVVEEEKIMMCGLPGLRYVIEYKDGERRAEFRELLIEHDGQIESYQFMHDYSPTGRNLFEGKAFFESVKKVG